MIEKIRRYTGLIIVVIVVLMLGFIFMDTSGFFRQSAAGSTYAKVNGRGYTHTEFINIGRSPLQLAGNLRSFDPNGLEIMRFSRSLMGNAETEANAELNFFAGRLMIQQAGKDFGIHPTGEDIRRFTEGLQMFQEQPPLGSEPGTTGDFDQGRYNDFVKNLGAFGLTERDFQSLIADVITAAKLREILGSGLTVSSELAQAMAVVSAQQIEVEVATLPTASIREKIQPTDEELKSYWDTVKDAYMTDQRIKVSYLLIAPEYSEAAKEPDASTEEDDSAKEERAALRKEEEKALAGVMNDFITELGNSEGADFEKLVEENEWELISTDWITLNDLPNDLRLTTRGASAGSSVSDYLFALEESSDPLSIFTNVLAVGTNQWLVARLDALEEPRIKEFEEAKEAVTERYISEKVGEALQQDLESKGNALKEAVASGESFTDAAKALGLETKKLGPFEISDSLNNEFHAREIFQLASTVSPGEFAEPLVQEDRALIIYVVDREILKDDNRGAQYDNFASRMEVQNENAAFSAWLAQQLEDADLKIATAP
ncbi:MAG: SurA N-terminal domain-containing protein [Verrucomicrobiales bacterium]